MCRLYVIMRTIRYTRGKKRKYDEVDGLMAVGKARWNGTECWVGVLGLDGGGRGFGEKLKTEDLTQCLLSKDRT